VIEFLSFKLYSDGKEPLSGIDPRKRVSKRIWREEGVDLDLLSRTGIVVDSMARDSGILEIETKKIRTGLLRLKRDRKMLVGLSGLAEASERIIKPEASSADLTTARSLCRSELVKPLMLSNSCLPLVQRLDSHSLSRSDQRDHIDISPDPARRSLLGSVKRSDQEEDISKLFKKKVGGDLEVVFRSGMRSVSLSTLISGIMEADDEELTELISNRKIIDFVSVGLKSPILEASIGDLIRTHDGSPEEGSNFRTRFGRYIMESPLAEQVSKDLIGTRIDRMMNCNGHEAGRIAEELTPYMDQRSVRPLLDILYKLPNENRSALITLMAATGSRDVVDPLKRLYEYSNLSDDRKSSKNALLMLGIRV